MIARRGKTTHHAGPPRLERNRLAVAINGVRQKIRLDIMKQRIAATENA
jgi:hypothetical protein